jgi:hypothetical protein
VLFPSAADPTEISRLARTPAQISWELHKSCGAHLLPTRSLELLHRSLRSKEILQAPCSSYQQPTQSKYHGSLILLHRSAGNYIKVAGPTYRLLDLLNFCTDPTEISRLTHTSAQISRELKNFGAHLLPYSSLELLHRSLKSKEISQATRSCHSS